MAGSIDKNLLFALRPVIREKYENCEMINCREKWKLIDHRNICLVWFYSKLHKFDFKRFYAKISLDRNCVLPLFVLVNLAAYSRFLDPLNLLFPVLQESLFENIIMSFSWYLFVQNQQWKHQK